MSTGHSTLSDFDSPNGLTHPNRDHLTKEKPGPNALEADGDREWYCSDCGSRITITTVGDEAGHRWRKHRCQHRPKRFRRSNESETRPGFNPESNQFGAKRGEGDA